MSETLIDDRANFRDDGPQQPAGTDVDAPTDDSGDDGDGRSPRGRFGRAIDRFVSMPAEGWITLVIVCGCVGFVFYALNWGSPPYPAWGNVLANNTPAGGDMGAHVWGPAFLRDHLLPQGRLTGWAPDWYAGFPAYEFYMVVPGLAIALLSYVIPYGIAFKLVAVSGVLSLPVAAWAFGRLTRMPFPLPAALAVGATAYLFDRSWSIYGGNIASTLAGEFSFSISLTFALLFLGVLARGFETGRYRAWAAALLALTALCHIIPVFFAVAGALVLFALQLDWSRIRWWAWLGLGTISLAIAAAIAAVPFSNGMTDPIIEFWPAALKSRVFERETLALAFVVFCIVITLVAVVLTAIERPWGRIKYLAVVLPVGAAISAFWTGPFYFNSKYMTDMGWEKITTYSDSLFSRHILASQLSDRPGIQYLLVLAAVGVLMAFAYRRRGSIFWVVMAGVAAVGFLYVPQSRLWNARLLPFYYLAVYLVGAIGLAELGRTVARIFSSDLRRPARPVLWATAVVLTLSWWLVIALPLHALPFGHESSTGRYAWGPISTNDSSFVTSWANWNFTGYEGKQYYPEYYAVVKTMAKIGQQNGCGRAMWEYSDSLNNYGTPMALMLLPYWTNGCIGSMEGLYFEASATTPYHFLNQSELSASPSDAMRGLDYRAPSPYTQQEFDLGIQHLQMLGVRYYMAQTSETIGFAKQNSSLHELARSGPWVVYQVADSPLVQPLQYQPAVVDGAAAGGKTWLNDTENWYLDPSQWSVLLAASGPKDWHRIAPGASAGRIPVGTTKVSNVKTSTDHVSFDVSKTGVPVEVKVSYFPNWQVSGADGPYRVSPNLMVVIPHSKHVELSYGYTSSDVVFYLISLLGLASLFVLWRTSPVRIEPVSPMWLDDEPDDDTPPPPVDDPRDPAWWVPSPSPSAVPATEVDGERVPARDLDPAEIILGLSDAPNASSATPPPDGHDVATPTAVEGEPEG
jgi:hypothetical protein